MSLLFRFLELAEIEVLHRKSLEFYGGQDGIRSAHLIESALGQAQAAVFFGGGDVFDASAAYLFHISEAQAFQDGNKRTAALAAETFLIQNGVPVDHFITAEQIYEMTMSMARGDIGKQEVADELRALAKNYDMSQVQEVKAAQDKEAKLEAFLTAEAAKNGGQFIVSDEREIYSRGYHNGIPIYRTVEYQEFLKAQKEAIKQAQHEPSQDQAKKPDWKLGL